MTVEVPSSGRTSGGENFPVASFIVEARHRRAVMAFYRFARGADDVADAPDLAAAAKLALLGRFEATLRGAEDGIAEAAPLRAALADRGMAPEHPLDLLRAFRTDAEKNRYASWDELMHYCRYSAAPVGRFVLDLHGESRGTWPASDALCAALQIINHLQDCAKDYRSLDRVYLPLDALAAAGADVEDLAGARASVPLRAAIAGLAMRAAGLLDQSATLSASVRNLRLGLEIAVIHRLARRLAEILKRRDPLSETVHLGNAAVLASGFFGLTGGLFGRIGRSRDRVRSA